MYLAQCMTPSWAVSLVAKSCLTLETPWTIACQAPLSMGFPRQEYWSGLPFPSLRDLPDPGIKPVSPALTGGFFTTEPPRKLLSRVYLICFQIFRHHFPLLLGGPVWWKLISYTAVVFLCLFQAKSNSVTLTPSYSKYNSSEWLF